jgi:hypothetical protein
VRVVDFASLHPRATGERWCRHRPNSTDPPYQEWPRDPGLKPALIKILQDFNLQLSLLDGCKEILDGDCADLAQKLHKDQTSGFLLGGKWVLTLLLRAICSHDSLGKTMCPICGLSLQQHPQGLVLLFLCRHVVHAKCARGGDGLPHQSASTVFEMRIGGGLSTGSVISGKIALCVHHRFPFFQLMFMLWFR